MRKLDGALGQSPAAILAGNDDLEKNFDLTDGGSRDGLQWLHAVPKSKDTTFEMVRIGMKTENGATVLAAMELQDTFGQTSILKFGAFQRNPVLAADAFRFVPPKGADVMGGDK